MTDTPSLPPVFHDALPIAAWMDEKTRRLPGIQPLAPGDWLRVDEAFAGQMALRDRLITTRRDEVLALEDNTRPAAEELLERVLAEITAHPRFTVEAGVVRRPDGVEVTIDRRDPLATAGRLVQCDLCLLDNPGGGEHVLLGAVLCFPASWTLREKFGRGLLSIHEPVPRYDTDVAKRVQRLFDAVRPEQPLWRVNALSYGSALLHHPRPEYAPRSAPGPESYVRAERQCILRLPVTRAVVFSIHTYLLPRERLSEEQEAGLTAHPFHRFSA
ncbi:hypothetical protein CDV50_11695 [Haematobacter massiliensis]|uniref:Uncharacterized protein n=1 Tax=Haematobacter massiliensis TaxID=195105 RepID=A0A086XXH0_9RHOB|nr:DUF3445 domain-containing protein [Haematobacter massiliensis]KFI26720.1 hypothetical protein CN97_02435 [Haematobacter massiliensis]OWJ70712.1 hypothetical protein CDV50_11695 [Haematobacter massiliensis]OWJ81352.1 hypothetical protein CDV51_19550 [Haematobacter massiliensis]QBJ23738.1 DUF3445 domain-containing protein [Haematobacter massiliensis]